MLPALRLCLLLAAGLAHGVTRAPPGAGRRQLARLLAVWSLLSPTGLVWAGPVAEASAAANQQPTITATPAGIPLINIAAPNAAGQSYNRYERLDSDTRGLIFNNSRNAGLNALGEPLPANPNLDGRSAKDIINEVVTAFPSTLNGPLAVFGDTARLILINPNGITCNGCGFINTSGVALSTGTPRWLDGAAGPSTAFETATALAFDVRGGRIEITGRGLSSALERLDLIAQTLGINAPIDIGSGALSLIAGRQSIYHGSLTRLVTLAGNDQATIGEDYAIDASVLGAMNAGSIRFIATASGMGVRSESSLAASSGDLLLSSNGELTLKRADAARDLELSTSGNLSHTGLSAARDLSIDAARLDNRSRLRSGRNIAVQVDTLTNQGSVIEAARDLLIRANTLSNGDAAQSTTYVANSLAGHTHNVLTTISDPVIREKPFNECEPDGVDKNARPTLLGRSAPYQDSGIGIEHSDLTLTQSSSAGTLSAGRHITVNVTGVLSNNASLIIAGGDIALNAGRFANSAGQNSNIGRIHAGDGHHFLGAYSPASATVQAAGTLTITAPIQSNSGTLQGRNLHRSGTALTDGLADVHQPPPAAALPARISAPSLPTVGRCSPPGTACIAGACDAGAIATGGPTAGTIAAGAGTGTVPGETITAGAAAGVGAGAGAGVGAGAGAGVGAGAVLGGALATGETTAGAVAEGAVASGVGAVAERAIATGMGAFAEGAIVTGTGAIVEGAVSTGVGAVAEGAVATGVGAVAEGAVATGMGTVAEGAVATVAGAETVTESAIAVGTTTSVAVAAVVAAAGGKEWDAAIVLDLFGGETSQIPGAINVDIAAKQGVRASATRPPFKAGIADEVVASNPYIPGGSGMIDFLSGATDVLSPGGKLIINATARNPFGVLPSAQTLESLGLRLVQERGPLLPKFGGHIFRFTNGRIIPPTSIWTTILEKALLL